MAQDNRIIAKIRKGNNTVIICDRVMVLALYTSSVDLILYPVLFNSVLHFQRYATDKVNAGKRKGSNSVNTGDRVMVLAFCNFPHSILYQYIKFH